MVETLTPYFLKHLPEWGSSCAVFGIGRRTGGVGCAVLASKGGLGVWAVPCLWLGLVGGGRWMATRAWDRRHEMTAEGADAAASLRQATALYVGPKLPDEPEGAPVHAS